jgi:hypothetical protein
MSFRTSRFHRFYCNAPENEDANLHFAMVKVHPAANARRSLQKANASPRCLLGKPVQNASQGSGASARSHDSWFGVTYREDRPQVIESMQKLIAQGQYPEKLWG